MIKKLIMKLTIFHEGEKIGVNKQKEQKQKQTLNQETREQRKQNKL